MVNRIAYSTRAVLVSLSALICAGIFSMVAVAGFAALILTFVQPPFGGEHLYRLYKITDTLLPLAGVTLAAVIAVIWLLVANSDALKEAFERSFRNHDRWIKMPASAGFFLFMAFFFGTRGVDHQGGTWELTGKGGRSTITGLQAIPQLWTDIRWHAAGMLLAGSVITFLSVCLYLAVRGEAAFKLRRTVSTVQER